MDYDIVKQKHGFVLLKHTSNRYTVIRIDEHANQAYNAMPGDAPPNGGQMFASPYWNDSAIAYVSCLYSRSYAYRVYRRLVAEEDELQEARRLDAIGWPGDKLEPDPDWP